MAQSTDKVCAGTHKSSVADEDEGKMAPASHDKVMPCSQPAALQGDYISKSIPACPPAQVPAHPPAWPRSPPGRGARPAVHDDFQASITMITLCSLLVFLHKLTVQNIMSWYM